jgi:hypothetical protein
MAPAALVRRPGLTGKVVLTLLAFVVGAFCAASKNHASKLPPGNVGQMGKLLEATKPMYDDMAEGHLVQLTTGSLAALVPGRGING